MNGSRLVLKRRAVHFDSALAPREHPTGGQEQVLRVRADDLVQLFLAQSIDDPTDVTPVDGPGAHRAWLGAGVQCAFGELLTAELLRRLAHQVGLRVPGTIALGDDGIFRFQQNSFVLVDEQRAEWVIAVLPGAAREGDRRSKMLEIDFVHGWLLMNRPHRARPPTCAPGSPPGRSSGRRGWGS